MEIERKFLVKQSIKQLINLKECKNKEIEQYYINFDPEVRIRKDNNYTLTIKSDGKLERQEFETIITLKDYNKLKKLAKTKPIFKTRYFIPFKNYICELDIYHNIKNLITVEVEFETKEEALQFVPPDWFREEITNIDKFKNKNLAYNLL